MRVYLEIFAIEFERGLNLSGCELTVLQTDLVGRSGELEVRYVWHGRGPEMGMVDSKVGKNEGKEGEDAVRCRGLFEIG